MKNKEIERKWVINDYDEAIKELSRRDRWVTIIEQGYYDGVRYRKQSRASSPNAGYYQTIKVGEGLIRGEYEIKLTESQFQILWPLTKGLRICKERTTFDYGDYTLELDKIFNVCVVMEVEFKSEKAAADFPVPKWFGKEVTDDISYSNYEIAKRLNIK